jgi:hypothetical protein
MLDLMIAYWMVESEMTALPLQFAQSGELVDVTGFISFVFKAMCIEKFVEEVWGVEFGM